MSNTYFKKCPRCETRSYEQLGTHGYCVECLYSGDLFRSDKSDFLTLKEAEDLLKIHTARKTPKKSKREDSEAAP